MAKRKTYTQEFKLDAIQKWQSSGQSAAAIESELDLSSGSLYRWKNELAAELESAATSEPVSEPDPEPDLDPEIELSEETDVTPDEQSDDPPIEPAEEDAGNGEDQPDEAELDLAPVKDAAVLEDSEPPHKPSLVKRIAGVIAVILAGIGIVLSIVAIVGVWVANKPITDTTVEILATIDGALEVVEVNLAKADTALQTVRDSMVEAAASLPIEEMNAIVSNLESLVEAAETTAETANNVVSLANAFPFVGPGSDKEATGAPKLDELTERLTQISTRLESLQERILGLSEGGVSGGVIDTIDGEIAQVQTRLNDAESTANEAGATVVEIQLNIPRWIDIASVVLTLIFLWLGIAQYSLLVHGWSWFRV